MSDLDQLIAEIVAAFAGVTRDGGVSWGQATAQSQAHEQWMEENVPKPERLFKGRDITWRELTHPPDEDEEDGNVVDKTKPDLPYHDGEPSWWDLIADADWNTQPDHGGFSYLDPIGSRYYLPAAMVRSLQDPEGTLLSFQLTVNDYIEGIVAAGADVDWRADFLEKWSALNDRQSRAVKHFVEYKMTIELANIDGIVGFLPKEMAAVMRESILRASSPWSRAYASYWESVDSGAHP